MGGWWWTNKFEWLHTSLQCQTEKETAEKMTFFIFVLIIQSKSDKWPTSQTEKKDSLIWPPLLGYTPIKKSPSYYPLFYRGALQILNKYIHTFIQKHITSFG